MSQRPFIVFELPKSMNRHYLIEKKQENTHPNLGTMTPTEEEKIIDLTLNTLWSLETDKISHDIEITERVTDGVSSRFIYKQLTH